MALIVLGLVLYEDEILLVQEALPGAPWYPPAGRVETGETLADALRRECLEEAGIAVQDGDLVAVQQGWRGAQSWTRFVFRIRHGRHLPLKDVADSHSLKASWFPLGRLAALKLRSNDFLELLPLADAKGLPLEQLSTSSQP